MSQFAAQVHHALDMNLQTRLSIVQATAAQIAISDDHGDAALRRHLDAVRVQFPEFAWLEVADAQGKLIAATAGALEGRDVAGQIWFQAARTGPFRGDLRLASPLEGQLHSGSDRQPLRFLDVAAPIPAANGGPAGVIAGHLSWGWMERLQTEVLGAVETRRKLELLLADSDGRVLVGPPGWAGQSLRSADVSEGGAYTVGRHAAADEKTSVLPWTIVVRQRSDAALDQVRTLWRTVLGTVLLAGGLAALAALLVTRMLTRRLAVLARDASAVRRGQRSALAPPAGDDEVGRIGAALSELVTHLQQEKAGLAALNAQLDARVAERTVRIERLAEETKHAAVTRERLRLARDLHDTLAHSMMALLTQIRLVRKLKAKLTAEDFAAELARAEEVATSGLAEARAAITQMRHGTVRDSGLASALRDLVSRFGERTGVQATLHAAGQSADLADERAETLYRIVEEALRNVERHANARSVRVSIEDAPASGAEPAARAVLKVQDDGVGFDAGAPCAGHYGLLGMREQAALMAARLDVRSAPGQGTSICLEFAA
jgi:signal transduction histidine kinase